MSLNGGVKHALRAVGLLVVLAGSLLLAACGRSGFQYIENDDDSVFLKIPADWSVLSEGLVNFTLTNDDGDLELLPGDSVLPWQAVFAEDETAESGSFEEVLGIAEVQPVDRRLRSDLDLGLFFQFDLDEPDNQIEVLRRYSVTIGDVEGVRVTYRDPEAGATFDRLVVTDDRRTAVYLLRLGCSDTCYSENAETINEIMTTFTVTG